MPVSVDCWTARPAPRAAASCFPATALPLVSCSLVVRIYVKGQSRDEKRLADARRRRTSLTVVLQLGSAGHRTPSRARIAGSFLLLVLGMLWPGSAPQLQPAQAEQGKQSNGFPHDCNPTRIADNDIRNFHQVDRDLYRGARPAYRKDVYLKLVGLGIRTIVNLETGEASKEEAEVKQINQELSDRHLPQVKFIHFPISPTLQVILTGLPGGGKHGARHLFEELQQAPKPIFLHCNHGKDRTGAIVVLYRMRRHELAFQQAYEEALHYKFNSLDGGLIKTIRRYRDPKALVELPDPDASAAAAVGACVGGSMSLPTPVRDAP